MAESFEVELYNHLISENTHVIVWKADVTMLIKFPIGTAKKKFYLESKEEQKGFNIDFEEIKMPIKDISYVGTTVLIFAENSKELIEHRDI